MAPVKVYLVKGDESGWAIDVDRALTKASLERLLHQVELVESVEQADVVHAVWWEPMMELPAKALAGKVVVCHFEEDPRLRLTEPGFAAAMGRVDHWIAQSHGALAWARAFGLACSYVPYAVDVACFANPCEPPDEVVSRALERLPDDAFVVGNFHRDTLGDSYGTRRLKPKLKKGPDVFVQVLAGARAKGVPVVALLAGPRRHWIRHALDEAGVDWVYVGEVVDGDDYGHNTLPLHQLAHVYRACDLHVSCSRHEGGPRGVLEAAAAAIGQLSTPVGVAPDVLAAECLFEDVLEGVEKLVLAYRYGMAGRFANASFELVRNNMTVEANVVRWAGVYDAVSKLIGNRASDGALCVERGFPCKPVVSVRERPRRVSFWNEFHEPPWGGGNQFMLALERACVAQGIEVSHNGEGEPASAHLLNSCWFDVQAFERCMREQADAKPRVVQRIDGPIHLYRRTPDSMSLDALCFDLNERYAHATVIQSSYTLKALAQGGYRPVRPVIVHNGVDESVFAPASEGLRLPGADEPLRVVAASWSNNPGKGAGVYQWLDAWLGRCKARFGQAWRGKVGVELTFVGRINVELRHWNRIEALPSQELAKVYQQHHVYLTASRDDPCSNALIEAQRCGLPALYLVSGGHQELVGFGGVGFERPAELPELFETMRRSLDMYRALVQPPAMTDVARRYLQLLFGDRAYQS